MNPAPCVLSRPADGRLTLHGHALVSTVGRGAGSRDHGMQGLRPRLARGETRASFLQHERGPAMSDPIESGLGAPSPMPWRSLADLMERHGEIVEQHTRLSGDIDWTRRRIAELDRERAEIERLINRMRGRK